METEVMVREKTSAFFKQLTIDIWDVRKIGITKTKIGASPAQR